MMKTTLIGRTTLIARITLMTIQKKIKSYFSEMLIDTDCIEQNGTLIPQDG
jgi:hypothetical protein